MGERVNPSTGMGVDGIRGWVQTSKTGKSVCKEWHQERDEGGAAKESVFSQDEKGRKRDRRGERTSIHGVDAVGVPVRWP